MNSASDISLPILKDLGQVDFDTALALMQACVWGVSQGTVAEQVWLLEHPQVITATRSSQELQLENIDSHHIPIHQVDRGGRSTFHGPGQLVCYPIVKLKNHGKSVKSFITALLNVARDTIYSLGIAPELVTVCMTTRRQGDSQIPLHRKSIPGVYVDGFKVASIGLRIKHGIVSHGLSLNYGINLKQFFNFQPCGLSISDYANLQDWLPHITKQQVYDTFSKKLYASNERN